MTTTVWPPCQQPNVSTYGRYRRGESPRLAATWESPCLPRSARRSQSCSTSRSDPSNVPYRSREPSQHRVQARPTTPAARRRGVSWISGLEEVPPFPDRERRCGRVRKEVPINGRGSILRVPSSSVEDMGCARPGSRSVLHGVTMECVSPPSASKSNFMFVRETEVVGPDGTTYVIRLRRTGIKPFRGDNVFRGVQLVIYFLQRRRDWTVEVGIGRIYELTTTSRMMFHEDCPSRDSAADLAENLLRALKAGRPLPE